MRTTLVSVWQGRPNAGKIAEIRMPAIGWAPVLIETDPYPDKYHVVTMDGVACPDGLTLQAGVDFRFDRGEVP